MNQNTLFAIIAVAVVVMGLIIFFFVVAGARTTQALIFEQQKQTTLDNPYVTKGLFALGEPAYQKLEHTCTTPFPDLAYINVVFRYREIPESCTFYVNKKYIETVFELEPDCIGECPTGEFSRTYPLGPLDIREDHSIEICCDDLCNRKILPAECNPIENPEAFPGLVASET